MAALGFVYPRLDLSEQSGGASSRQVAAAVQSDLAPGTNDGVPARSSSKRGGGRCSGGGSTLNSPPPSSSPSQPGCTKKLRWNSGCSTTRWISAPKPRPLSTITPFMPLNSNHNTAREQRTQATTGDSTKNNNLEETTRTVPEPHPDPQQREMLMLMCIQALKEGKSKLEEQVTALQQQLEGAIAEAREANQKASVLQAHQLLTGAPHTPQPEPQTCPSCHCSEPKYIDPLDWCSHE